MAQQYIGSRISLISKSDIRYRGVLHSIDPAASTVSLEQVRSMGTEGRKSNPAEEIAPTDTLYEFIVFRAADVKDLSIEAAAEPKLEPPKPSVPDDPAIMSTTAPPRHTPATNHFMPQHPMQPPQGMYGNMPPMMYGPGGMPPQWPPYGMPPPPGQMHPMMGFPQHPLPPPMPAPQLPGPANNQTPQSPPNAAAPPTSSAGASLPAAIAKLEIDSHAKTAPLPTASPSKQLGSTSASTRDGSGSQSASGVPPASSARKSPAIAVNGTKSVFGAPTAMDMMNSIVAKNPISSTSHKATQPPPQTNVPQHRHPLPQAPTKPKPHTQPPPKATTSAAVAAPIVVPPQDFDFASANAKFNKSTKPADNEVETKEPEEVFIPEAPPGTYYDKKKSFFDDISSEVKERSAVVQEVQRGVAPGISRGGGGGGRGRGGKGWDRNAERQKNLDTFGDVALNPNLGALGSGYNGYGRGGVHRMGGGGFRGMGRGGRGYPRGMMRGAMAPAPPFQRG